MVKLQVLNDFFAIQFKLEVIKQSDEILLSIINILLMIILKFDESEISSN